MTDKEIIIEKIIDRLLSRAEYFEPKIWEQYHTISIRIINLGSRPRRLAFRRPSHNVDKEEFMSIARHLLRNRFNKYYSERSRITQNTKKEWTND